MITNYKLEISAIMAVIILALRRRACLSGVPLRIVVSHFLLVSLYAVTGIAGFRFMIWLCLNQSRFMGAFSSANPLGIDAWLMRVVACVYSIAACILFVSALRLGDSRNWARQVFVVLVLPCSLLYPSVIASAVGVEKHQDGFWALLTGTGILTVTALFSISFYLSKNVRNLLGFS